MMTRIMWSIEDFSTPLVWPKKARRAFLLTLPISGPLWVVTMGVLMVASILALFVLGPLVWVGDMWGQDDS